MINENGREINNDPPIVLRSGVRIDETMDQKIQRILATTISRRANENGIETLEESEDFDVDDDEMDMDTPYTMKEEFVDQDFTEKQDTNIGPSVEQKQENPDPENGPQRLGEILAKMEAFLSKNEPPVPEVITQDLQPKNGT